NTQFHASGWRPVSGWPRQTDGSEAAIDLWHVTCDIGFKNRLADSIRTVEILYSDARISPKI
ncbi:MAG TPA: hypothetical protein PK752_15105, partial [Accumulibacter sp.]